MELIEINSGFQISVGAPEPIVIADCGVLTLSFYIESDNEKTITLIFRRYSYFRLGVPGNETLSGHPYSIIGLKSHSFYELKHSDLIENLKKISSIHPKYDANVWLNDRHYILTFHDNMFECIAQEFEIREENTSLYNQAAVMLNKLSVKHF
jgi:hypothetical protein